VKVLIADDHKVVRIGLGLIVKEEFPDAVLFQAGNAAEVYSQIRTERFDLMLMDLKMPDTDSQAMLEQVLLNGYSPCATSKAAPAAMYKKARTTP
jgi:DNA-binding NarL/FixJ family response regulator